MNEWGARTRASAAIKAMSSLTQILLLLLQQIVEINVGGYRYTTPLQTLRKDPNSMLAAMFRERDYEKSCHVGLARDSTGAYFIDYDGSSFGELLNYLRGDGSFIPPRDAMSRERLQRTACYFQVLGLLQHLGDDDKEMSFAEQVVSSSARGVQATAIRTLATIGAFGFRFVIFGLVLPTKEDPSIVTAHHEVADEI